MDRENSGEDHDRENEIGKRPGNDDRGALPHALAEERHLSLGLGHRRGSLLVGHRGAIGIAVKFHIAAKRQKPEPPARAPAIDEARDLRPETEREGIDLYAAEPADEEMPQLMEEDDDARERREKAGSLPATAAR